MDRLVSLILLVLVAACSPPAPSPVDRFRIGGSASARDLAEALVEAFRLSHPRTEVEHAPPTHSGAAIQALKAREIDVAYLTREPTAEERSGLFLYPFALDPLVFAAHRTAGVTDLTTQQIRRLYDGTITRWSQVGGADVPVVLLDRPSYTSPRRLLNDTLLADLDPAPGATVLEGPGDMDHALRLYPGALGYTSLRAALALEPDVRVLRVDGVYPDPDAVRSGRYRLNRPVVFAVRAEPLSAARRFLEFLNTPAARRVATARATVPVRRSLRIGVPPMRNIVALEAKYGGLARYLQARLGLPVDLVHQSSYTDLTEAFRTGRVNAAFAGSFAYLVAHAETGAEVLARPDYGGVSHYRGVVFVRSDSPFRSLADLRGRRVVHAGLTTTAGQIFPMYALKMRGLGPPQEFFGEFTDAGSHEAALRQLLEGAADAAAAKDLVWGEMVAENPALEGRLRELAASAPVPSNGFVAGPTVSPALRRQIRNLLLSMHESPQGRKALTDLGADRFLPTTDEDYQALYEMVQALSDELSGYFQYR
ncbi:phosphate/phosphite/phosphonate ABC transporter substrate-binding protein [Deferrisoma camini]|uniref:phosphate/phosphite/phosphonate ABC transporter substrate-binding protein n=1 Tax=Deferrisoma camini TaxID=1035120 RepID=UPI00046D1412|nr:phosphate/phosphite/phosphonate ABC transporter substrate-binding protein [Deferrisoma camini]